MTFCIGQIVATPAAIEAMEQSGQTPDFFLKRHVRGDWGQFDAEDWQANDQALLDDSRVISAYQTLRGDKIWVITEAADDQGRRAATTFLLQEEY